MIIVTFCFNFPKEDGLASVILKCHCLVCPLLLLFFTVLFIGTFEADSAQGERVAESDDDVICWKKSPTSYSFINKAWLQKKVCQSDLKLCLGVDIFCIA